MAWRAQTEEHSIENRNKEKPTFLVCRLLFALSVEYYLEKKYMNNVIVLKFEPKLTRTNMPKSY